MYNYIIIYNSICVKFKNRQNWSVVLEVRIVITFGEGQSSYWMLHSPASGVFMFCFLIWVVVTIQAVSFMCAMWDHLFSFFTVYGLELIMCKNIFGKFCFEPCPITESIYFLDRESRFWEITGDLYINTVIPVWLLLFF